MKGIEPKIHIHCDVFDSASCRVGGDHQWFGDGIVYYDDFGSTKSMSQRKYDLLTDSMRRKINVIGGEVTCNKCGTPYTRAHNPHFI